MSSLSRHTNISAMSSLHWTSLFNKQYFPSFIKNRWVAFGLSPNKTFTGSGFCFSRVSSYLYRRPQLQGPLYKHVFLAVWGHRHTFCSQVLEYQVTLNLFPSQELFGIFSEGENGFFSFCSGKMIRKSKISS